VVLPCGADEGGELLSLVRGEGVDVRTVPIAGRTRSNITLVEPDGTKVNEPGPVLSAAGAKGADALAEGLAWGAAAVR